MITYMFKLHYVKCKLVANYLNESLGSGCNHVNDDDDDDEDVAGVINHQIFPRFPIR